MNFFRWAFTSQSKNDGKPRHSLWTPVPVMVFTVVFLSYRALDQSATASKQQTSFGTIGQCEQRGRGHENYCHYTFQVGEDWYTGVNQAEQEAELGQTVVVYYNYQDPDVNALQDFAEQSRKSRRMVYILLLAIAAVVAFIYWNRKPYPKTSDGGQIP